MANYTTNIGVLKREIFKFTEKISEGMARPFHKFTADMCYGAMASKSCLISEMAQVLQEDTQKINTIERLTRNLGKEIPEPVRDNYLNVAMNFLPKDVVVHIDDSDVVKPRGKAFEGIDRVRDGSKSTQTKSVMGNGYYVTEATALTYSNHPVSVFSEVWLLNPLNTLLVDNLSTQRRLFKPVQPNSDTQSSSWIGATMTMTFFVCWTSGSKTM